MAFVGASKMMSSFGALLAILLLLMSSIMLATAAKPLGRKLLQQGYGGPVPDYGHRDPVPVRPTGRYRRPDPFPAYGHRDPVPVRPIHYGPP
ncbi:hypothetical protein GLYMA_04G230000v4 [Glycine max]|uniref:Uncharacterized protein n=2 Tax=Glycine subgen. Soja TaxID=1462606 RepID=C6T3M7_SOYBN|nr:uncharacterized protein LOC100527213 precursor [Glycine max]KAG5036061.1 hypothetical protein JHK87_010971 [Glycine soja]ACU16265.1 unknown [Glycine max]KAH1112764.1 hypothetical protein GYH30_010826 [Glycine max]KHN19547.1 hypothetical protein glysoja_027804 [Glycine soja]KRH64322.1 hypothetical protein GLYMA_04G230000v4 [Glycine max]|eukprot:NP_001236484.1 uncharacterized protein LOC100527213 precursor [Glycine max]